MMNELLDSSFLKAAPSTSNDLETFTSSSAAPTGGEFRAKDDLGIVPGHRGDITQLLSERFIERKRSAATKIARAFLYGSGIVLFPLGFGLLSKSVVVPSGSVGIAVNNGHVEIMGPGRHCLVSPFNRRKEFKVFDLSSPTIHVQNFWLITCSDAEFVLARDQGKPLILGPGVHLVDSPFFAVVDRVPQNTSVISHQTLHRVVIPQGMRGVAQDGDKPLLLSPGVYTRVSPVFSFKKAVNVDQQIVRLSPFTVVTTFTSQVGVAYKRGVLAVLQPGTTILSAEHNEEFVGFLEMTEQVRDLKMIEILTSDGLAVGVHGSISFRISSPVLAITNIGDSSEQNKRFAAASKKDNNNKEVVRPDIESIIFNTILTRANNTLASLLTGSDLLTSNGLGFASAAAAMHSKTNGMEPADDGKGKAEAAVYGEKERHKADLSKIISHEFTERLTSHLLTEWGVSLISMSVTDVAVRDEAVKQALAFGVKTSIEATNARRNAEASAETMRIQARGAADAERIKAEGEAAKIRLVAQAQEEAGKLLENAPVAVQLRLAEAGATALGKAGSVICVPDAGVQSILGLIGASNAMTRPSPNVK